MSITHSQLPHKDGKGQCAKFNRTVPIIWYQYFPGTFEFAMAVYNEILFYISYSFCLAFRLCFSMIVFYASLQAIKLSFLENKSRYVCCIFAITSYLHLAQKVNQFLKKRELYVFYRPNQ